MHSRSLIVALLILGLVALTLASVTACGPKSANKPPPPGPTGANPDDLEGGSGARPNPPGNATNPPTIQNTPTSQRVRVWFATNRAMIDPADPMQGFANTREPDPDALHLGSVVCDIPNARPVGSVGSSWITRLITGEDDRITITDLLITQPDAYYRQIAERLAQAPPGQRSILLYIHGYKNSFSSAAVRAAQLAVDLRVPGLTAFYSWPSRDAVSEYNADEAAVETAEKHLRAYLLHLARDTGATDIHIIAHSMGNRVLARVMHRLAIDPDATGADGKPLRFGQIILAAPDIDQQVFADLAAAYPKLSTRTTLYVSQKDKALEASAWTHSFPRAGYAPPVAVLPPIDTVEVTHVDVSILGHGYVAETETVLDDVAGLLRKDTPPAQRRHLRPSTTPAGKQFWIIDETPLTRP